MLYIAEIMVMIVFLAGVGVYTMLLHMLPDPSWLAGCQFRTITGIICPACGSTRAVQALFSGHIVKAFYYHPALMLLIAVCVIYFVSQTIKLITKGRTHAMAFHVWYVYVWLAVEVLQYILKLVIPGYII